MQNPASDGVRHTVRSLARATSLSPSKIQRLITEERPTVTRAQALRIAEVVSAPLLALFTPTSSPYSNGDGEENET